jgi:hypothetical protein
MLPLYSDAHFTFHFADDRLIPRFHLEGLEVGRHIVVYRLDSSTGTRRDQVATGRVADGGWVDLKEALVVRAGETFIAVPLP